MKNNKTTRLIVAASESDADMFYATKFFAPDPFIFLEKNGKRTLVLSDLEIGRARRQAKADEFIAFSKLEREVQGRAKKSPPYEKVLVHFLRKRGVRSTIVPANFPLGYAQELGRHKIRLKASNGLFWPKRAAKSDEEIQMMGQALRITEAGLARAVEVLKASKPGPGKKLRWSGKTLTSEILRAEIDTAILHAGGLPANTIVAGGDQASRITEAGLARAVEVLKASKPGPGKKLRWSGKTLTSEILRAEIDTAILHAGGLPANTIVAGGDQACDPHERGFGPLFANSLIILDIFPRDAKTGYFGDLTRTVLRGRASDAQRKLWETVKAGQELALKRIKAGIDGAKVHKAIQDLFAERGYATGMRQGRHVGFFHGTGHGLGLEIHEYPRVQKVVLEDRQVVTVEPGLYYPGLGGVRIEDVVAVTKSGCKILSRFPKILEI